MENKIIFDVSELHLYGNFGISFNRGLKHWRILKKIILNLKSLKWIEIENVESNISFYLSALKNND